MESILNNLESFYNQTGPGIFLFIGILALIGVVAQWSLYSKCNLPGVACIIPFWNFVVFLKIMGRPWWHMFYLIAPPAVIAGLLVIDPTSPATLVPAGLLAVFMAGFTIKLYIELCQCFGKRKMVDYIMVVMLNGFYILNLALSYETKYHGPVYANKKKDSQAPATGSPVAA